MWLAGPSLGRELRARALSHTAPVPAWHRLRSQSPSRVQTATSHNKWSAAHQVQQPWREEHVSADMFLDLPTMSAPSGEERTPNASAQVERAGLCLRRFSGTQPGVRCVRRSRLDMNQC